MTAPDEIKEKGFCSNCGSPIGWDDRYCTNCGFYMVDGGLKIPCNVCGTLVKGNFCPKCGSSLEVSYKEKVSIFRSLGKIVVRFLEGVVNLVSSILDSILGA